MLDEVAWLFKFNLRGTDIEFNTAFFGYVAVTRQGNHACGSRAGRPGRVGAAREGGPTASI